MHFRATIDASATEIALLRVAGHSLLDHALAVAHKIAGVEDIVVLGDKHSAIQGIAERWGARVAPMLDYSAPDGPSIRIELDVSFPFRDPTTVKHAIQKLNHDKLDRVASTQRPWGIIHSHDSFTSLTAIHAHEIGSFTVVREPSPAAPRVGFVELHPLDTHRVTSKEDSEALEALYPIRGVSFEKPNLAEIELVAFDFDGVMTDDTVIVRQDGIESVIANRGDGMGLLRLKQAGIRAVVISKETNVVVAARCRKLDIPCHHGIDDKLTLLTDLALKESVAQSKIAFVGNDVNDVECIAWAGCGIAVANSRPEALAVADWVTTARGGHGAVREVCEAIIAATKH